MDERTINELLYYAAEAISEASAFYNGENVRPDYIKYIKVLPIPKRKKDDVNLDSLLPELLEESKYLLDKVA